MNWFRRRAAPAPAPQKLAMKIKAEAVASVTGDRNGHLELTPLREAPKVENPFAPAKPMGGVKADAMAMDEGFARDFEQLDFHEGIGFLGYAYLAELSQRPEYRHISETIAEEMTREWVQLVSNGDDDDGESFAAKAKALKDRFGKVEGDDERTELLAAWLELFQRQEAAGTPRTEKLKTIDARMRELKARDHFRRAAEIDGLMGRAHIYIDTGKTEDADELKTALVVDRRKVRKGGIKRLTVVEPTWSYPNRYNSTDPLKGDFYKPQTWFVMAKEVHRSRLMTFVGREVPDILKPAYAFGGLSMSQMAMPYVQNWLRTRQSVSDLLASFTTWVVKTDLSSILLGGDATQMNLRADMFNRTRDNRGLMMLDKGAGGDDKGEEFENISAQLGTLDKLQAQAQEQMAAVSRIPLVKLLGITPSGLNASSDGEIRVFYDHIAAYQEKLFGSHLDKLLKLVQLDLFGEIDPDIGYEFKPLWQLDDAAAAAARKADADIDCEYLDRSVLSPKEVRRKVASDRSSPYASLDVDDLPEPPDEEAPEPTNAEEPEGAMPSGGGGE